MTDWKLEFEKRRRYFVAFAVFIILFVIVYFVSEKVAILDEKTHRPAVVYSINENGGITSDYEYRNILNPLLVVGITAIVLSIAAFEEMKTPKRMKLTEILKSIDGEERAKYNLPPLTDLLYYDAEIFYLEGVNKAVVKFKKDLPDGRPLTLYIDANSNFRSYATSPILAVDRTRQENTEFHLNRLKMLIKKQVFSLNDAIGFIAQTYSVPEKSILLAIEKLKKHEETKEVEDE